MRIIWKIIKWCLISIGALLVGIILLFVGMYLYYEWFYVEWPTSRIENVTGVRVPDYNIIKTEGHDGIDYEHIYYVEFEEVPSDDLFDDIDKRIANGDNHWEREGNEYKYSVIWGNGLPTPKGENEDDDGTFSISMTKGSKEGIIESGAW